MAGDEELSLGQGGPNATVQQNLRVVDIGLSKWMKIASFLGSCLLVWLSAIPANVAYCATDIDLHLRVVWGGGSSRAYSGAITISEGSIQKTIPLSMQADSAITVIPKTTRETIIPQSSPTRYGGAELHIIGTETTKVRVSLSNPTDATTDVQPVVLEATLAELLKQNRSTSIDESGNALVIERSPADKLRIIVDRDHFICKPEEAIALSVSGHHLGVDHNSILQLNLDVIDEASGDIVTNHTQTVTTDDRGSFDATSLTTLYAPTKEGVYRVVIQAKPKRILGNLLADQIITRSLQFVVLAETALETSTATWQSIDSWEPSQGDILPESMASTTDSKGSDRNRWLNWRTMGSRGSWWSNLSRQPKRSPISKDSPKNRGVGQLGPGDWYLIPLRLQKPGRPHRLVVRYSSNNTMRMGITLLETNGEGLIAPLGVESGMEVNREETGDAPTEGEHEVIFWPKSNSTSLLITNPDGHQSFSLLGYELQTGPEHLPSSLPQIEAEATTSSTTEETPVTPPRLAAIYLDKPLLAEYFGGVEVTDTVSGRSMHAWQSYYYACQRLVEYLKWSGHNGVIFFVSAEGGSLYPSEILRPNAKFDRGMFFTDGRDPVQKDVVELLLQILDREGMHILLGIHFDGALSTAVNRQQEPDPSVELISMDGAPWSRADGIRSEGAFTLQPPRYNPLHPSIQGTIERATLELVQRYSKHRSFRGVVLEMGGGGHLSFGGDRWGYDNTTLASFAKSLTTQTPSSDQELRELVKSRLRAQYMQWRATQLTQYIEQLAKRLRSERSDLRLVISNAGLAKQPPLETDFINWSDLWMQPEYIALSRGLDLTALSKLPEIDILEADVRYPLHSLPQQRWSYAVRDLQTPTNHQLPLPRGGSLLLLPPTGRNWPAVEKQQPNGISAAKVWTFPQIFPADASGSARWANHLLNNDCWIIAHGGWSPNFGSENVLREATIRWQQLPPVKFEPIPSTNSAPLSQSVSLRTARYQGKFFIQAINSSSWKETCHIELDRQPQKQIIRLVSTESTAIPKAWGESKNWDIELQPYEWQTICIDDSAIDIQGWTHSPDPGAIDIAKAKLFDLSERVRKLHTTRLAPLESLVNGGFEEYDSKGEPLGWTHSTLPSSKIEASSQAYRGKYSIRLANKSDGNVPLWVQSSPITVTQTGRLATEIWVRKELNMPEPKVRLSLIGRRADGSRFERSRWLGRETGDAKISDRWEASPLVLLVSDLPTSGIEDVRLEIDLIGTGVIYLDEVKIYDVYLHPDERNLIRNEIFAASEPFRDPSLTVRLDEIDRFWKSYWGEYLRRFVPLMNSAPVVQEALPDVSSSKAGSSKSTTGPIPNDSTATDAVKGSNNPTSPGLLRRRLSNLRSDGSAVDR